MGLTDRIDRQQSFAMCFVGLTENQRNYVPSGQRQATYIDTDSPEGPGARLKGSFVSTFNSGSGTKCLVPVPAYDEKSCW